MPSIEITTTLLMNKQSKEDTRQEIHIICKMLDDFSRQHKKIMFTYATLSIDAHKVQIHTQKRAGN
jgi:hypothetical protein